MNHRINKCIFLLLITFSCDKWEVDPLTDVHGNSGVNYSRSLDKWNQLKNQNGRSYMFKIINSSFSEVSQTTQFRIDNGVVVERIFESFQYTGITREKEVLESYAENINDLGSHTAGFPVTTLDELYQSCARNYLNVRAKNNTLYFDTNDIGILKLCGSTRKNCMDDCFYGVRISDFEWL